jgi:TolB-like protein/Tfp pilus assembly protein PilF
VWELYGGIGRELLGLGAASKPVEVVSLATPARLTGRPSVAVLPFKNLSGDPGQDFFSDGITEDVITALGRFSNLLVVAKSASFQLKGRSISPGEVGRLLDARYLLDGSVRRSGDHVRVNVELIEAETGRHLWSEVYDAEPKDIFAVQDEIARRVVGAAAVKLTRLEQDRVLVKPTGSLAAYEYVLRGRERLVNATREENDGAREMFQRAIDLDPNYAAAYASLGNTYFDAAVSGWEEFPNEAVERAETLGQKALTLDPTATGGYRLLAAIQMFRRHYDLALSQIDRSLEVNPSDTESYVQRGAILVFAGKSADAVPWLEAALRFDRANTRAAVYIGMAYFFLDRYENAVEAFDRALARMHGRLPQLQAHAILAATYAEIGRDPDAAGERGIISRLAPFFSAERFAGQFGTQQARDHMLEGLKKAGFR